MRFFLPGPVWLYQSLETYHLPRATTIPEKTRPNQLSESQKREIDREVTNLLEERNIVESNSSWNSTIHGVPKGVGLDDEQKWLLVVEF